MAVVLYGTEELRHCTINNVTMRNVFSDDGIDYERSEYRIDVSAVLAEDLENNVSMQDIIYRVRTALGCSRQPLTVWIGDNATTEAKPPSHEEDNHEWGQDGPGGEGVPDSGVDSSDPDIDAPTSKSWKKITSLKDGERVRTGIILDVFAPDIAGGPKVENINIQEIEGHQLAVLTCTLIASVHACTSPPGILWSRWEVTTVITKDRLTKLTFNGRARVNPSQFANADDIRSSVMPPIPPGFHPGEPSFTMSSDGLYLTWRVTYEERYQLPPFVFTDFDANITRSTTLGAITMAVLRMNGTASRTVAKSTMLQAMALILLTKFKFFGKDNTDILKHALVSESLTTNDLSVEVHVQKCQARNGGPQPMPIDQNFGQPLLGAPVHISDMTVRGPQMLAAIKAAWKNCCSAAEGPTIRRRAEGTIPNADIPPIAFAIADLPESEPNQLSDQHDQRPYVSASQFVSFETESGIVPMPLAKKIPAQSTGGRERTVAFVRLHQPFTRKRIRFQGKRAHSWPDVPHPNPGREGAAVKTTMVEAENPELTADLQSYLYGLSGEHEIILDHHLDATTGEESFVGGRSPMYKLPIESTKIPSDCFKRDLADLPSDGGEEV